MEPIRILYLFDLDEGQQERYDLQLDGTTLEPPEPPPEPLPDWTRLDRYRCPHCPLDPADRPHCPVAARLAPAVELFGNVCSHDRVRLTVITAERRVQQETSAQRALSSLMGLLIATSGCPHTDFLKPMARFHLPLASEEETLFRATGMYLIAQYFVRQGGGDGDLELAGLSRRYQDLHRLNTQVAERLRAACRQDSTVNAVVLLDLFTNLMPFMIEERLEELHDLFRAFLATSSGAEPPR